MKKLHLYFDSNTESGETSMAYAVYDGAMRLRPVLLGQIRGSVNDEEFVGYNQYMYKLETLHRGIKDVQEYIKKENLMKFGEQVEVTCYSQHTMINGMVSDRSANGTYVGKVEEILRIVDTMGSEGVSVSIAYVKGPQNYAKKFAGEMMLKIRLEPKKVTLTNSADKVNQAHNASKIAVNGGTVESNVIEIAKFKVI